MQGLCAQVAGQQAVLPTLPRKGISQGLGLVRFFLCRGASQLTQTLVLPTTLLACIQQVVQGSQSKEQWRGAMLNMP